MTAPDTPGATPAGWVPEFPGQRPPFAPGNTVAVGNTGPMTHGGSSPRKVEPIAAQYLEAALSDEAVPYLREARYRPALVAWAQVEARVALIEKWVTDMSIEKATESGQGRTSPLELLRKWEATAMTHRDRLGLTPASAARLGREVAQGRQADAATELTRLRAEHEASTRPDGGS